MRHIATQRLISLLISFLALTSCAMQKTTFESTEQSRYILNEPTRKKVIVFVHGVLGDSTSTWTNNDTSAYWPKLIAQDKDFSQANIYVFQYPTPPVNRSLSVNELAEKMRIRLQSDKVIDYQELIFLSHSMGGLITRAFLVKNRDIAAKVRSAYFFATPTEGSPYATLASLASRNPQFKNMYPLKSDNYLADLQRDWLSARLKIQSYCAYEGSETFGVMIVDQRSATNLCTEPLDPMVENHIEIVKPKDAHADAYIAFKNAYISSIKNGEENSLPGNVPTLPGDTGWIFAGYFNIDNHYFIEGPYVTVTQSTPTRGMRRFVEIGDTITLKVSRDLHIVNFKQNGVSGKFISPVNKGIIDKNDKTGVNIPAGTKLLIRDLSEGHWPGNPNAALWLRVVYVPN